MGGTCMGKGNGLLMDRWLSSGHSVILMTQGVICKRCVIAFRKKQACAKTCCVVTFGLVLGAWVKMRMEKVAAEGLQAGQVSVRRQGRSEG
ncbi:hypothetical protein D0894_18240 [Pseudomonas monteilii]|uniref:Uncharacterized protein n=1 Tax=Pseudomonas monteilii TaxID=76759 RepID=A0A399M2P0_9PSED|nr:hypothetical protein D0894_18240 [Pseudomonas monteilii]